VAEAPFPQSLAGTVNPWSPTDPEWVLQGNRAQAESRLFDVAVPKVDLAAIDQGTRWRNHRRSRPGLNGCPFDKVLKIIERPSACPGDPSFNAAERLKEQRLG
jgi:hypothetical protein